MEILLGDALDAWCRGEDISQRALFGLAIYWWARLGTLIQLLSAAYVVVELIGPIRLREVGLKLRGVLGEEEARRRALRRSHWLASHVRFLQAPSGSKEEEESLEASTDSPYDHLNTLLTLAGTVVGIYWAWPSIWLIAVVVVVAALALVVAMPLVTIAVTAVLHQAGIVTDCAIIHPLVRLLERKDLSRILTLGSLLLLVAGTCLASLAS